MTPSPEVSAVLRKAAEDVIQAARLWAELGWCAKGYARRQRRNVAPYGCECDWCSVVHALNDYDAALRAAAGEVGGA